MEGKLKPTNDFSDQKLLPPPPPCLPTQQAKQPENEDWSSMQLLVLGFLTFNSGTAIYRSLNEPWTIAFVIICYLDLILLFWCLRLFERAPENSSKRDRLKVAIWLLSTLLTLLFSYKVALIMPLVVKIIVWLMAGTSTSAGFYAFFIYKENTIPSAVTVAGCASKV